MRSVLLGASLLALIIPAAHAQQVVEPAPADTAPRAVPERFVVHFGFGKARLDAAGRQVVAQAAEAYRNMGEALVSVTGYTDTAGTDEHNQALAQKRAETVRDELVRLGVPEADITPAVGAAQDLAVPTGAGVPEARNRRVEIEVAQPATGAGVAPAAGPAPAPEPAWSKRFAFTLGPVYGHDFREKDRGGTRDNLAGAELTLSALPGFLCGLSLKQDVLWAFDTADDGLAGRSVLSLDFAPDLGFVRPRLSANFGGVYGKGVQAGLVAGPELALDLNLLPGFTLRPKVAYDLQLRNPGWDEGILWTSLDLGLRF